MKKRISDEKGIVLITVYFVVVVLLGLSAVIFMRATNEARQAKRVSGSYEAFYNAEAGISYGYAEASRRYFGWYTHIDKDTPITSGFSVTDSAGSKVNFDYPIPISVDGGYIDATGYYQVEGKNFRVKSYPEKDKNDKFTGVTIIRSQATVNGATRTIEYRLGQQSAYKYFFFYPKSHTFDTATYDGRNYGGIHVNGNIYFKGNPTFSFLTELTCGSQSEGEGFISRPLLTQFDNCGGPLEDEYNTTPYDVQDLPAEMYKDINFHFSTGTTYFQTGDIENPDLTIALPFYLEDENASWEFDKYEGDYGDANDKLPLVYTITDKNLKDTGIYEISGHTGTVSLFDDDKTITVTYQGGVPASNTLPESLAFQKAFKDEQEGKKINWTPFWKQWKANHNTDYQAYQFEGGKDWERRFYLAAYDMDEPQNPYGVNTEWWEDLEYGSDRPYLIDDFAPAEAIDDATGETYKPSRYFLNTEEQTLAWEDWLSKNNLDEEGENKTLIQDKSQGGKYVDPGTVVSRQTATNTLKERAESGGIYIGLKGTEFENPITDCTAETAFYNAFHPARSETGSYTPTNVLVIDVHTLKKKIEQEISDFNGIVYVDLAGYNWSQSYDSDAQAVMLVNGERLPDGGLSIVTPDNVYIKGNYNLDPAGSPDKNRPADASGVISRVTSELHYNRITGQGYTLSEDELSWQPAEIITNRAVYTLSEDFPEPPYMPMCNEYTNQYYAEENFVPEQDFVSGHPEIPTNEWAPSPTQTREVSSKVNQWFKYYEGGQPTPAQWDARWIKFNWWPRDKVFLLDTNGDGQADTSILSDDLINDVCDHIEYVYDSTFNYSSVHDAAGSTASDVSQINEVSKTHIYNTAIVTPYETEPYVLEYWGDTARIINGSFIQLPDQTQYKSSIPANTIYIRTDVPDNFCQYESRFGRGSTTVERPAVELTFGADSSWREIVDSASF